MQLRLLLRLLLLLLLHFRSAVLKAAGAANVSRAATAAAASAPAAVSFAFKCLKTPATRINVVIVVGCRRVALTFADSFICSRFFKYVS